MTVHWYICVEDYIPIMSSIKYLTLFEKTLQQIIYLQINLPRNTSDDLKTVKSEEESMTIKLNGICKFGWQINKKYSILNYVLHEWKTHRPQRIFLIEEK